MLLVWFCLAVLFFNRKRAFIRQLTFGFILFATSIGVSYFIAWSILSAVFNVSSLLIFSKPIFWGLLAILAGVCFFLPALSKALKANK
jgi:hypothetical protein